MLLSFSTPLLTGLPELAFSAFRSAMVALLAVAIAHHVVGALRAVSHPPRRAAAAALIALPFLTPRCLLTYCYMAHAQATAAHVIYHQLFYGVLLLFILVPVAVALVYFAPPPPMTRSALYCRRLARSPSPPICSTAWFAWHRHMRARTLALIFTFLMAFTEMEMASLFGIAAWTVRLFDLQAGGLPLTSLLAHAAMPVLLEAALLAAALVLLVRTRGAPKLLDSGAPPPTPWTVAAVRLYLVAACVIVCIVPTVTTIAPTLAGGRDTWTGLGIGSEMRNTLLFAAVSTLCVWAAARATRQRSGLAAQAILCVPGLLGGMALGLGVLAIFQHDFLRPLRDSPLPLLMGLMLYLMPFALLLTAALTSSHREPALHAASMLRRSPRRKHRDTATAINWTLAGRKWFFVIMFLLLLACFDLILASLLAPADMPTMMVMVYNQMHYGTSRRLGAMLMGVSLLPLLLCAAAMAARRGALLIRMHA